MNTKKIKRPEVAILMSTYNGQEFVAEQIESVLSQSFRDWFLFVRDDGSSDRTVDIINSFVSRDDRITLIEDQHGNMGAAESFALLMQYISEEDFEYICYSDQDDIWLPEKLEKQMRFMKEVESKYPGEPILVHSDLEVVDMNLDAIAPSFMAYQGVHHEDSEPLTVLLAQNYVTGCTTLMNRRLLELALPVPNEAMMHDWWLALVAAACGKIAYIDEPLVKYRQHGANEVGAKGYWGYLNPFAVNWLAHWNKGRRGLLRSMAQATKLAAHISSVSPKNANLPLIEAYASLPQLSFWQRVCTLAKNDIHSQSRLRHCLMLSRLFFLKGRSDG